MKVQDLMTTNVRACTATDTLNMAAQLMWDGDLGTVPVVDDEGRVIGMVTDRDIAMAAYTQGQPLWLIPVRAAMSKQVFAVGPKDDLHIAQQVMRKNSVRRLPVLEDDGHLVGLVSTSDLALAAVRQRERRNPELTGNELCDTLAAISLPRTSAATAARG